MFAPQASVWWCENLQYPFSVLAETEALLNEHLPDRLLSFNDLITLSTHPAAQALRALLVEQLNNSGKPRTDELLNAARRTVIEVVEQLGCSYVDATCGVVDPSIFSEPFGSFPECRASREALDYIDESWPHLSHRAGFALAHAEGARPKLKLIHEYSCELWLSHLTQHDMQRTLDGDAPWGKSAAERVLRPF